MTGPVATTAVVKVLLVDDSPDAHGTLTRILRRDGDITVIGRMPTGKATIGLVTREHPDVVVLDLNPKDGRGLEFIEQLMARTPTPILVLSSAIENRQSASAVEALVAGAVDALPAPVEWTAQLEVQLRRSIRQIAKVHTIRHPLGRGAKAPSGPPPAAGPIPRGRKPVVALAASTGGPSVLATVLAGLHGLHAPVLVVQHLHADFTGGLLDWMSRVSALPVEIAKHNQVAHPGRVYLAPGGFHLRLAANNRLELASVPVTIHRPSANELFRSVADHAGASGVGVIMTGMGDDGAVGLLELLRRGGQTFGQDEASSAVFGMPQAARRLGAVTTMLPPDQLAPAILRAAVAVAA